ncbi:unnamed protein product [Protopolystoma xenopodis]|uniref:Uncharacterized protein n=1 Tax=Protopolystoma xenopodis TaxID=117903 RepID=A0A448WBJ4_9PLAT|nr:unnamed protein product [Protopolystoma xenopodis]
MWRLPIGTQLILRVAKRQEEATGDMTRANDPRRQDYSHNRSHSTTGIRDNDDSDFKAAEGEKLLPTL